MHKQLDDAYARLENDRLIFGNRTYRRELDLAGGCPRTVSLRSADGVEYADPAKTEPDFYFVGLHRPGAGASEYRVSRLDISEVPKPEFDAPHLLVTLEVFDDVQQLTLRREFFVYPGLGVHAMRNSLSSPVMPNCYWSFRRELASDGPGNVKRFTDPAHLESGGDSLELASGFVPVRTVEFFGRTDYTDHLVTEHPAGETALTGNLCFVENSTGQGLFYLQEAPPSSERRDFEEHDFRRAGQLLVSCTWGIPPAEVRPGEFLTGHRHTLGLYGAAAEAEAILKTYLGRRFPMTPENYSVMVNPWGCGRFPELVGRDFLVAELKAAAEAGATHYQIDDSWQTGAGLNDMTGRNRLMTPAFWTVSEPRLGGTLEPLCDAARKAGIEPALWIAPSANAEYRDWRTFSEIILDFHRRYGINNFKIDGVLTRTHEAERNLEALLRTVRQSSGGKVYFNLDTTNGQRPGYFQFLEYGNIFLENRYVCHTWSLGYQPEKTLRSLWLLARYCRTQTLQIEIPDEDGLLPEYYENKPFGDPRLYSLEYRAAIALFANPLLWFAPSLVPAERLARYRAMMELHRAYRDRIFAGVISPVGGEPNGNRVTGFYSDSGYLVAYREKNAFQDSATFDIPSGNWCLLAGIGEVKGQTVRIDSRPGFAFFARQ